jgi:D-glycero-alpha-D-manno-heptose 1-phosphate guanylyltransferase
LRPVVDGMPKCLAPIAGRPFLAHQLEALARGGVRKAVICTGYLATQVSDRFGRHHAGIELTYSAEEEPLGTGGAIRLAISRTGGDEFLVVNGDSFTGLDYQHVASVFYACNRQPLMVLTEVADTARYGRVEWVTDAARAAHAAQPVERYLEKGVAGPGWINAGIYLLPRDVLEAKPVGEPFSLERDVFPELVSRHRLLAAPSGKMFIDIGTPESYGAAEEFFDHVARTLGGQGNSVNDAG